MALPHLLLSLEEFDSSCEKKIVPKKLKFLAETFACFIFDCHCLGTGVHKLRTYSEFIYMIYLSVGKRPKKP